MMTEGWAYMYLYMSVYLQCSTAYNQIRLIMIAVRKTENDTIEPNNETD